MPTHGAFADSKSPFGKVGAEHSGKGGSEHSLSERVKELEELVAQLVNPPLPSMISGVYAQNIIQFCEVAFPSFADPNKTFNHYSVVTDGTLRFYPAGQTKGLGDGTIFAVNPTSVVVIGTKPNECPLSYEMTKPADGTFTYIRNDCALTDNTTWLGTWKLRGRIFDGGKTLTAASTTPDLEQRKDSNGNVTAERYCARMVTLRKVSD